MFLGYTLIEMTFVLLSASTDEAARTSILSKRRTADRPPFSEAEHQYSSMMPNFFSKIRQRNFISAHKSRKRGLRTQESIRHNYFHANSIRCPS